MPSIDVPLERGRFGQTARRDLWWLQPLLTFLALSTFIVYATWAGFQGVHYSHGPYLSPFYSPMLVSDNPAESWFGARPTWLPAWVTGAMLILWAPGGFRLTCYYYRGAYYKAFWADPPSCTVGEPRKKYRGEKYLPLIVQNIHRYFLYIGLIFIGLLAHDAWRGFFAFQDGFQIRVGSIVLLINVVLLACYTFGCHSLRHLIGGLKDRLSRHPVRKGAYDCVSCLNRRHMMWAWCSLFWVAFSDLYVRMCSMHIWTDWRIL
jgi:hypothetical protein